MRTDLESLEGLQEVLKVLSELHKSSNYFNFWTNEGYIDVGDGCWGPKFAGYNFEILVTVLAILVTNFDDSWKI